MSIFHFYNLMPHARYNNRIWNSRGAEAPHESSMTSARVKLVAPATDDENPRSNVDVCVADSRQNGHVETASREGIVTVRSTLWSNLAFPSETKPNSLS